jgi:hypothetical protein
MVVYDTTGNRKEPALLFRLITDHGNNKESKIPYYRGSDFRSTTMRWSLVVLRGW